MGFFGYPSGAIRHVDQNTATLSTQKSRSSMGIVVLNSGSAAFRWGCTVGDDPECPGFTERVPTRVFGASVASPAIGPKLYNYPPFMVVGN